MIPPSDVTGLDCWSRIGIAGDGSCPELKEYIHCRNCPVYATAARGFFGRSAPAGYLADWARLLAAPFEPSDSKDISLLIFRLRNEWLALRTQFVVEVTPTRPVHRIPHRSNDIIVGLVNLRGQLQLQVSLHGLLGIDPPDSPATCLVHVAPRLVVVRRDNQTWAFEAEDVLGVHRFTRARLNNVPSTLANPANSFSQAVISWREKSVGFLDDQRVVAALNGLNP